MKKKKNESLYLYREEVCAHGEEKCVLGRKACTQKVYLYIKRKSMHTKRGALYEFTCTDTKFLCIERESMYTKRGLRT